MLTKRINIIKKELKQQYKTPEEILTKKEKKKIADFRKEKTLRIDSLLRIPRLFEADIDNLSNEGKQNYYKKNYRIPNFCSFNPNNLKKFYKEKLNFLNSLLKSPNSKDYYEDSEFRPIQENLIGEGKTAIVDNENRREITVGDLADKETKRLEKLKSYKFERIIHIIKSPLIPVIFRTTNSKKQDHFCDIPDKICVSPTEANQGTISNCYFISSLASMAEYPEMLKRIF